jgi:hypothetical protein
MAGFEVEYDGDLHAVEYMPGRWYSCNALDKYSCLEIAKSLADEETGYEVGNTFDDMPDTGTQIDITAMYPTIDWQLIAMMGAAVLFIAALERG